MYKLIILAIFTIMPSLGYCDNFFIAATHQIANYQIDKLSKDYQILDVKQGEGNHYIIRYSSTSYAQEAELPAILEELEIKYGLKK